MRKSNVLEFHGAFNNFPAQHWQSIRTSNPIESTFGTIRHRTKRSKGCLSRDGMLHMMFKLGQCAETKGWFRDTSERPSVNPNAKDWLSVSITTKMRYGTSFIRCISSRFCGLAQFRIRCHISFNATEHLAISNNMCGRSKTVVQSHACWVFSAVIESVLQT